ncbi:granzyme B-like, partial [Clarias magur]
MLSSDELPAIEEQDPVAGAVGGMEVRIIGGNEVKPHSRPYVVSVQINKSHMCGGMLIRNDYVLTAAHCVDNTEHPGKDKLEVLLGAHNISDNESEQQRIQVKKYIKHPCYKKNERLNDIMLLKLKSKAKQNKAVKTIGLPKNENVPEKKKCSIAGWGRTHQNSNASSVLREVTLKIQNNNECKRLWRHYFDTDNMICTAPDGRKAFCQGDSGSPLICGEKLQGLVAYNHPDNCLDPHKIKHPREYKLEVLLGAHNISDNEPQQQRIPVQNYTKHPCYKKNERQNDIMLLK